MSNYLETYDNYDSPLINQENLGNSQDLNFWIQDPVRLIQQRMIILLGIVLMIATSLALLAIPVQGGTGSAVSENSQYYQYQTIEEPEVKSEIIPLSEQHGIADFFTQEVQYWEPQIINWSEEYNVDPNAVATIMQIESCGDPQAVSVAGARGLFQVMPFHFSGGEDMLDPETNARRGLDFFNEQLRYTDGDIFLSFAGYNGGYAASGGNYENWANETQRYYQWAKGIYEDANSGVSRSETLETWLDAGGRPGCQRAAGRLGI